MTAPTTQIARLLAIMARLRAPGGCPWDVEQDHKTLKPYLLEEACEVIDAIDHGTDQDLAEELGDLLLQVVFHAQIAAETGRFDFEQVAKNISDKLVRRHPHVFEDIIVRDAADVVTNWDAIKKQEKIQQGKTTKSFLDDVPRSLPALFEAHKLGKKAAKLGFDWNVATEALIKVEEEIAELKKAIATAQESSISEECGDLLLATANLCRHLKLNAELTLRAANQKFRQRFAKMEKSIASRSLSLHDISPKQWDELWNEAKSENTG